MLSENTRLNYASQISLVRGDEAEMYGDSNVGELLKRKASEGVRWWQQCNERLLLFSGACPCHDLE